MGLAWNICAPLGTLSTFFFDPVFQVSTAKNEINLFNKHILIVAPVTCASRCDDAFRGILVIFDSDYALISCPLCNSNILWNILMVRDRNVAQDEMTCCIQE